MSSFIPPKSPRVSDIRAAFEARQAYNPEQPSTNIILKLRAADHIHRRSSPSNPSHLRYPDEQSIPTDSAMYLKETQVLKSQKPLIDTVVLDPTPASERDIDTVGPAKSAPRRPGNSTRPSWIGPKRHDTTRAAGSGTMRQSVMVEYSSSALQPPVFIFTSLSDPAWEAVEMDKERTKDGGWRFHKMFQVASGEYQYKFRLGPGDWWVTDDTKPVVDDGYGNKNNFLIVEGADSKAGPVTKPNPIALPGFEHQVQTPVATPAAAPLMDHEILDVPQRLVNNVGKALSSTIEIGQKFDGQKRHISDTSAQEEDHKSHSPLLKHEDVFGDTHRDGEHTKPINDKSFSKLYRPDVVVPPEADQNDPSLETFPSDRQEIYARIRRASMRQAENDALALESLPQQNPSPESLPGVMEEDEAEDDLLEQLREIEEEEAEKEEQAEADPLQESTLIPPMTPTESEDDVVVSQDNVGEDRMAAEYVQWKGALESAVDILRRPIYWIATFGLALGFVAGWYRLR